MQNFIKCSFCYRLAIFRNYQGRTSFSLPTLALSYLILMTMALPASADEQCTHLGIETVNWKSPESDQSGMLLLGVKQGCVAAALGARPGEIITAFNGKPIASQYDLETLAGSFPAGGAFSLTLKDPQGVLRTVRRTAIPEYKVAVGSYGTYPETSGDWMDWFKWAGYFLVLMLILTPLVFRLLGIGAPEIMIGGAAAGVYEEFKRGGRSYVGAAINGALMALVMLLGIAFIGPIGFVYNLYQPMLATLNQVDQTVCCVDNAGKYAMSPDGRWLAMVKPTPNNYFGLSDKIARTPYVAAMADLQTGQFIKWQNAATSNWFGVEAPEYAGLDGVDFAGTDRRPYVDWSNGLRSALVFPDKNAELPDQTGTTRVADVRFNLVREKNNHFTVTDAASGKSFTLDPGQDYDKAWLSGDGRVLALATRPYEPDDQNDDWLTQTYYTLKNFFLGEWTVTFCDVGAPRKLATYHGYGFDEKRWNDNSLLEASRDGRRWIMINNSGFAFVFDLSKKIGLAYAEGRATGPLYRTDTSHAEIAFYQ